MVYEGSSNFVGVASVALPDINQKVATLNGAGIAGDVEVPISGQLEAMTVTIKFKAYSAEVARLRSPGRHTVELRPAVQNEDTVRGEIVVAAEKHVMVIVPKGLSGATIAPASQRETDLTASVRYWKHIIDGETIHEIDPLNHIFIINGTDYGAPVRSALGL
jgi:hypothetical protein